MAAPFDPELIPEDLDAQLTPEVEAWHIRSVPEAEWAMRLLAALQKEADSIQEQADLFIEQLLSWKQAQLRPIQAKLAFFQSHLEGYALELRELTGKKSLALPSGKVTTHATKPRVVITDSDAFFAWLEGQEPEVMARCLKEPELSLSGIQGVVGMVEVPCLADVGMSCGCIWSWEEAWPQLPPKEGDTLLCPDCQEPSTVVQSLVTWCWVPQLNDKAVPGLGVMGEHVSSKAKPGAA
jgi:hypothetical protein